MNDNKFSTVCEIKADEKNYKKDRTVCKSCYNKKKRKNDFNTSIHETKIDNVNKKINIPEKQKHNKNPNVLTLENHHHVVIGPSNVGRTYYMLIILEKIGNKRSIQIITRSPNFPNNNQIINQVLISNQ